MEYAILALLVIAVVLLALLLFKPNKTDAQLSTLKELVNGQDRRVNDTLKAMDEKLDNRLSGMNNTLFDKLTTMSDNNAKRITEMTSSNEKKLDEMRQLVDEKLTDTLQKRVTESFKTVSDQLDRVYKGLGEMQTLATDVGGLKKVLSNVKTRGNLGEVQLGAILEEILSPEQYECNAHTNDDGNKVEYAVKYFTGDGEAVLLPIDSKFPGDAYANFCDAQETGDKDTVENAWKVLERRLKDEAKDIKTKYINPPKTTEFGILFLPFEGLFAEAVRHNMAEILRKEYNITIAGPTTMTAILNSFAMAFRTLALQKNSGEIIKTLQSVKKEFGTFEKSLESMRKHLDSTSEDLDKLMTTRTKAINRKLRSVETAGALEDGEEDEI